jgi:large subunit ribosomal protein L14e
LVVKDLPRGAGEKVVKKYLAKSDVIAKWDQTAWAQKIATRKTRASLSDFDRFKVQKFKSQVSHKMPMCLLGPIILLTFFCLL